MLLIEQRVNMLKIKLKQWDYTKNNAFNDLRVMAFIRGERRKLGKATLFFKNGRLVDVDGALKRKGLSEITLRVSSTFPLPSNVVVRTPSPSPSFITAPTEFKTQEDILAIYKVLLEQWQKTSSLTTMDDYGFSLSSRIEKPCVYHEMGHALSCANLAFDAGYSDLGGSLLKQAFLLVESIVRRESPEWLLVSPWQHLHQARRPNIAKVLIRHFHNLSRTLLPNGLVHRFFDSLVEATKSQPLNQFLRALTPGLMRILESAPEEILLVGTAVELLEGEDKNNQTMGLVSQIDKRISKWQSQIDKRSPSGLIADLDVLQLRLELTRQSGAGMLLVDRSRDFINQVQTARHSIFENHGEKQVLRMLDFFTASAFFAMSQGYKLLAKDQPNTSVVWQSESIRLLGEAIHRFNTVAPGAEIFKQTLHFRRLNSWMESGNQCKAEEDLQEILQILAQRQIRSMPQDHKVRCWAAAPRVVQAMG
jgi:hypothetical protein